MDAGDSRCHQSADGSVQDIERLPVELNALPHRVELPMKALIEMAADRGAFIDQSSH